MHFLEFCDILIFNCKIVFFSIMADYQLAIGAAVGFWVTMVDIRATVKLVVRGTDRCLLNRVTHSKLLLPN